MTTNELTTESIETVGIQEAMTVLNHARLRSHEGQVVDDEVARE